jgi:ribonuclease Z
VYLRVSVAFLGTGGPEAGSDDMPAVAVTVGGTVVLLDAGEGVQHKLVRLGIGLSRVRYVLVTHLHGDHVLGLIPLVQTRALTSGDSQSLLIVGPSGTARYLRESFSSLFFNPGESVEVREVRGWDTVELYGRVRATAVPLEHSIETYGYRLNFGGGEDFCYITDTRPLNTELLRGCSVIIHDSTFSWIDLDKAEEFKHSTALEAGRVASEAGSRLLLLYHISPRYSSRSFLEAEARRFFRQAYAAEKYMKLVLEL